MALSKGIRDPKPRVTHIKGTNSKSLNVRDHEPNLLASGGTSPKLFGLSL